MHFADELKKKKKAKANHCEMDTRILGYQG